MQLIKLTLSQHFLMELKVAFFTLLIFLFMVVKHWRRSGLQDSIGKQPPGPWKLPIIGNLHNLIGSLPHHSLKTLAKIYGPIMHLQLGEVSAVIISSAEAAKEVLKTHDLVFAQRPELLAVEIMTYNYAGIVFAPYGNYWRQMRKICILELLSAKRVKTFQSIREEEVSDLIHSISVCHGQPINLSEKVAALTNNITSRAAFGKKCKDRDAFISANKEAIALAGGFEVPDIFPSLKFLHNISGTKPALERMHQRFDKILNDILNEHKAKRNITTTRDSKLEEEDFVDVLLKLQESEDLEFPLKDDNIKAVILDVFAAGSETSSTTLDWAMSELMRNPQVMEKTQAEVRHILRGKEKIEDKDIQELHYLKSVVKETLRLHPPAVLLLPRESRERCEINGYEIPIKTKIIINAWSIGRDPKYWNDAECFSPERFHGSVRDFTGTTFEYIPFGAGRRICPGMSFGIANLELPLAKLLYHFDWKLPNNLRPEEIDMTEAFGATVGRKNDLYLIANPYIPSA